MLLDKHTIIRAVVKKLKQLQREVFYRVGSSLEYFLIKQDQIVKKLTCGEIEGGGMCVVE